VEIEASGQKVREQKPLSIPAVLGIAFGVGLSILKALIWSSGVLNGETLGYATASIIIPGLIAYAIAGRGRVRNPNRFALIFCALSFVFLLLDLANHHESSKDRVSRLAKEAAGTKPVDNAGSSEIDRLTRDMLREIMDLRKSHDATAAKFKDDLGQLYSANSFSSAANMKRSVDAVRGTLSADQEFSSQFQVWKEKLKQDTDHSSLSDLEKRDFMKGIDEKMGNSKILTLHSQIVEAEAKWVDSAVGLYTLAIANQGKIAADGSRIVINDENVRAKFNRELEDSKQLRADMRSLNSQMARLQRERMQQIGLTRKDIGVPDSDPPASH
jgi:hypothetical protein